MDGMLVDTMLEADGEIVVGPSEPIIRDIVGILVRDNSDEGT